jgi:hypothetical protein
VKYIVNVTTLEELKIVYRNFCKTLHPDKGGSTIEMQILNNEYELLLNTLKNEDTDVQVEEILRSVIEQLSSISGIVIEIVGLWVWVTGDTKPVKDQIKAIGLRFHAKRVAWFFAGVSSKSSKSANFDEIRAKYGSTVVKGKPSKYLT